MLEDFDLFVSLDTYKQSLENKKDLFLDMNELKEYSTLSDYLSVAIGAYDIISIENKYSQRQELL